MFLFLILLFVAVEVGGVHYGVDSRDGWASEPYDPRGYDAIRRNLL